MPVPSPAALLYALENVMRILAVRRFCAELEVLLANDFVGGPSVTDGNRSYATKGSTVRAIFDFADFWPHCEPYTVSSVYATGER